MPKWATPFMATIRRSMRWKPRMAEMLGKEAAIFVPSGTQSNLLALMSHCGRGEAFIAGNQAHAYLYEGGGAAVLASLQPQPVVHQKDGTLALSDIEATIKSGDIHFATDEAFGAGKYFWRQGAAARLYGGGGGVGAAARAGFPSRWGAGVQCLRQAGGGYRRVRGAVRHGFHLPFQGVGRAGWIGAGGARRFDRKGGAAIARCWAAACGRRGFWRRRGFMRWSTI